MRRLPFHLLLVLFLALPLAACDSDGDDDDNGGGGGGNLGEFTATLGGDLSGTFSGNAFFSVVDDTDLPGDRAFVLIMTEQDITTGSTMTGEFVGIIRPGERPATGQYPITVSEEDEATAFYFNFTGQSTGVYLTDATGTLTITSSSSTRVEGTFSFSGTTFDTTNPQGQGTGSVNGNFEAVFVDPGDTPQFPL